MNIVLELQLLQLAGTSNAYSETCQASKMKSFAKIANGWKPLTISAKWSISELFLWKALSQMFNSVLKTLLCFPVVKLFFYKHGFKFVNTSNDLFNFSFVKT